MSKTKTVITKDVEVNPFSLDNMSLEQRAEIFAMLKKDNNVVTQAASIDAARLNVLNGQKEEIEGQIAELNFQLGPILQEIRTLSGKSAVAHDRTRVVTNCPECGQGRHADNDKTKACSIYPQFKAVVDAAKQEGKALPTFTSYLVSIGKAAPSAL
jgi:hypothetical protein